jgi:glycosyltransferase involved in cell wall biosynthesis
MKAADIYVQTSRFEGYCLTLAEARILNVPCVTTAFDVVYDQMIDGENGLVVDMNAPAVAGGIERLMNDADLYAHIKDYQMREKKGNIEEIQKFYRLVRE